MTTATMIPVRVLKNAAECVAGVVACSVRPELERRAGPWARTSASAVRKADGWGGVVSPKAVGQGISARATAPSTLRGSGPRLGVPGLPTMSSSVASNVERCNACTRHRHVRRQYSRAWNDIQHSPWMSVRGHQGVRGGGRVMRGDAKLHACRPRIRVPPPVRTLARSRSSAGSERSIPTSPPRSISRSSCCSSNAAFSHACRSLRCRWRPTI